METSNNEEGVMQDRPFKTPAALAGFKENSLICAPNGCRGFEGALRAPSFINLDSRQDRKQQFLTSMEKFGIAEDQLIRFPAIAKPCGAHGCALSHIGVLERHLTAAASHGRDDPCLVFEDDFVWKVDREHVERLLSQFFKAREEGGWDVLMFAASIYNLHREPQEVSPGIYKVTRALTTTAYLVHPQYCETLLKNFKEAEQGLGRGRKQGNEIDVVWRKLQERDRWFLACPGWGVQADGFSDICKTNVQYKMI
jgi:hypothetical protein